MSFPLSTDQTGTFRLVCQDGSLLAVNTTAGAHFLSVADDGRWRFIEANGTLRADSFGEGANNLWTDQPLNAVLLASTGELVTVVPT
jgi:hypothetical protein